MGFPALAEKENAFKAKKDELGGIFREAGPDMDLAQVKSIRGTGIDKAAYIRKLNDELTDLSKEVDNLRAVQKAADRTKIAGVNPDESGGNESGDGADSYNRASQPRQKSIGELFVESAALTEKKGAVGPSATLDIHLKTLLTTSAGWAPEYFRTGQVVPFATRPVQVADLVPQVETAQAAVQYMEETTFTNAAAETAEAGTYPESALAFTERLVAVQKIAVFLPVTDEQLDDVPQMRGYIDNRLPFMIRQRLDTQLLAGNGTAPNLRGLANVVGIQTQAKGTDPTPDAIYKAIVKVEVTGQAVANAVLMHPNDWQNIRLLRTADGIYIWGNPSDTGPERIWGLQVVRAQAATAGTAIVGDFANFCQLAVRRGIEVQISNSHSTFFAEGKQALRADMRAAFVVFRPTAFCTVTGL
jgi:HK97 family phage major capsid protein